MTKVESATSWAEKIAADNSHGYSQAVRWGPSYDCSSLVISAWEQAGVPVKTKGATYTGNMYSVFLSCGFEDVTSQCNLTTGSGIIRGDVLLNHEAHTAMSVGDGRIVHARSSEGTSDTVDNSGNEIRTQSYWNYPWNCVLRYNDKTSEISDENDGLSDIIDTGLDVDGIAGTDTWKAIASRMPTVRMGSQNCAVTALQAGLNQIIGYNELDMDGEFGPLTQTTLMKFQEGKI